MTNSLSDYEDGMRRWELEIRAAKAKVKLFKDEGASPYWAEMALDNALRAYAEFEEWWAQAHDEERRHIAGWGLNK